MTTQPKKPEIILRDGKPVSVILDIDVYQQMLEQIEAREDLEELAKMRQEKLEFRSLDEFLQDYSADI
ncbi:MAG: type II toxin-antitoxin system Phd/YefM family antitoxin [Crocosphaera sp.]